MRNKISYWIVMIGCPVHAGLFRKHARKRYKELNPYEDCKSLPRFKYVGRVIEDSKRKGHGKIILEY